MRVSILILPILAFTAIAPAIAAEPDPHAGHHPAAPAVAAAPEAPAAAAPAPAPDAAMPMGGGKGQMGQMMPAGMTHDMMEKCMAEHAAAEKKAPAH